MKIMEKEIITEKLSKMFNKREILINCMFDFLKEENYDIYEIEMNIIDFMKAKP